MVAARARFAVAATPAVRAAFAWDAVSTPLTAANAVWAAVAAFVAIPARVSAAAWAFALTVAAIVAMFSPLRAAAIAENFAAIADFATAAVSAFDMSTRPAAICFARLSIGRFRAARSLDVPTIAGMAAFL